MEWQQAPLLQNQTLASYPECSTRPWEWWLAPCGAHPHLLWRWSQACRLWKTDRKSKYWQSCKVQNSPGPSDARTHEPANNGETKKVQLPPAQQDPRKEKLWATGPYAQTHSISQDHPLLETRTTPKNVNWSARGYRQRLPTWAREEVTDAGICQHQVPRIPMDPCLLRWFCSRSHPTWGTWRVHQVKWWNCTDDHSHRKIFHQLQKQKLKPSKKLQLRLETTYLEPSPMWSSSQMLSLSSANSKIPARKISTRCKLPWSTSQPSQT